MMSLRMVRYISSKSPFPAPGNPETRDSYHSIGVNPPFCNLMNSQANRANSNNPSTVSQSVDLGRSNNPNTTPTKDYEIVRVVVYLRGVQRGYAEEGERGSTPTG